MNRGSFLVVFLVLLVAVMVAVGLFFTVAQVMGG